MPGGQHCSGLTPDPQAPPQPHHPMQVGPFRQGSTSGAAPTRAHAPAPSRAHAAAPPRAHGARKSNRRPQALPSRPQMAQSVRRPIHRLQVAPSKENAPKQHKSNKINAPSPSFAALKGTKGKATNSSKSSWKVYLAGVLGPFVLYVIRLFCGKNVTRSSIMDNTYTKWILGVCSFLVPTAGLGLWLGYENQKPEPPSEEPRSRPYSEPRPRSPKPKDTPLLTVSGVIVLASVVIVLLTAFCCVCVFLLRKGNEPQVMQCNDNYRIEEEV